MADARTDEDYMPADYGLTVIELQKIVDLWQTRTTLCDEVDYIKSKGGTLIV